MWYRLIGMMRALLTCVFLPAALCVAQSATSTFEVAAIKPSTARDGGSRWSSNNGRLTLENNSIKQIIMGAYSLQEYTYSGPAWLEAERYNVDAKADEKVDRDTLLQMVQTMLADRFKLKFHREQKLVSGYAMVVAKSGLKVKPVDGEGSSMSSNDTKLTAKHVDMPRIAVFASRVLGQPVIDETGVKDSFDFVLEFERRQRTESDPNAPALPTLFTALSEQLGLKLEPKKVPLDVLVVDHAERPTEN
ncbi:MAG TPA: TIGR03435 family protein [Candidatus Solibacter sp.]|nr:TIGR03435 family protein [Candidatus Solibacter sp.]